VTVESNLRHEGPSHSTTGRVYIIVLNWNGWRDTIECLESVLRLDYPDYKVVVCDNGSSDGSLDQIRHWARGEIIAEARGPSLAALTSPPVPKPIELVEVNLAGASMDGKKSAARLLLIQTGANLGFAGGNNVGLRYALNRWDCDFAWVLNNDTVVRPDALSHLVRRMRERPDAGICGSTLLYYDDPTKVQACGGSIYNKWVARGGHIGRFADVRHLGTARWCAADPREVERKLAYVVGASMLVRRSFLEHIGLMDESYFLTFEEIDWATRGKGRFKLAYAPLSIVYHREGAATGSHRTTLGQSAIVEFYSNRNRVLFTRKHYPFALPSVLCAIGLSAFHRVLHRRWRNFGAVARGLYRGLTTAKRALERPL
jgi:GT2 family glycosyltransferase